MLHAKLKLAGALVGAGTATGLLVVYVAGVTMGVGRRALPRHLA